MKNCPRCKIDKSHAEFYKNKQYIGSYCKNCFKELYATDSAKFRENAKTRYNATKSARKVEMAEWRRMNPQKCSGYCAKRNATKVKATPIWAESEFEKFVIQEIYSLATLRSKLTGVKHSVDHIVPLTSKIVQGLHCVANLQILESSINSSKSNKTWPNMPY